MKNIYFIKVWLRHCYLLAGSPGGKLVQVLYKEGAHAVTDVIVGNVDLMFYHPAAINPHIAAGQLRAVGASSAVRSQAAPHVATMAEQGLPDFELIAWFKPGAAFGCPGRLTGCC